VVALGNGDSLVLEIRPVSRRVLPAARWKPLPALAPQPLPCRDRWSTPTYSRCFSIHNPCRVTVKRRRCDESYDSARCPRRRVWGLLRNQLLCDVDARPMWRCGGRSRWRSTA